MTTHLRSAKQLSLAIVTLAFTVHALAEEAITMTQIADVWSSKKEQFRTIEFEWTESRTYGKGTMTGMGMKAASRSAIGNRTTSDPYPPEDVTYTLRHKVLIDGPRIRYEVDGYLFSGNEGEFVPSTYWSVYDGTASGMYFGEATDRPITVMNHRTGFITKIQRTEEIHNGALWPILLAYRPSDIAQHVLPDAEWRLTGEEGNVDGKKCILLRKTMQRLEKVCWLDTTRDCAVLRFQSTVDGSVHFTLDISYEDDRVHGPVPAKWSSTKLVASNLTFDQSASSSATSFSINSPIDPEVFLIAFPKDTWVEDGVTSTKYIVRDAGERREITVEELARGATYPDLLHSRSGEALGSSRGYARILAYWAIIGVIVVAVGILTWRARYRRRRP
jgi:hypothetical protein